MAHPRDILISLHAAARKSLSQNFLTSPHWAERLTTIAAEPEAEEYWEIGPGLGALTEKLVGKARAPVRVFEYDRKLAAYLRERFPALPIVEGDFLDADLSTYPAKRVSVLSNLPYHLSSPILFKLFDEKERLARLVLTFQREFAERLIAVPRSENYGALSVIAQLSFRIQSIGVLPPGAFFPAPAVSSEALLFEPREKQVTALGHVTRVVKAAFAHRRKKVASNLKEAFPGAPVERFLEEMKIAPMARPEELDKEQYVALTVLMKSYVCEAVCEK